MTGKMFIYRGLPGSGKTTLAEFNAMLDKGRVVGRDHIRNMLGFSGLGTKKQENEVTELQGRLIKNGLTSGQNVHVDDMNLKILYVKRLMGLANRLGAEVEIVDLTNEDLGKCIDRDSGRSISKKVGFELISDKYQRFIRGKGYPLPVPTEGVFDARLSPVEPYKPDTCLPRAFLVDLDGTVALKGNRGFHDYDERVFYDLPNQNVIRAVRAMIQAGNTPIYVSGRKGNEVCKVSTHAWITKHITIAAHWLYMREPHDNREDFLVKAEIFDRYIRDNWNVVGAFDDRNQVVDMYREMGLTVFQVADGNF